MYIETFFLQYSETASKENSLAKKKTTEAWRISATSVT